MTGKHRNCPSGRFPVALAGCRFTSMQPCTSCFVRNFRMGTQAERVEWLFKGNLFTSEVGGLEKVNSSTKFPKCSLDLGTERKKGKHHLFSFVMYSSCPPCLKR